MKAAVLTGLRELEVRETPDPVLARADDVLLDVKVVGVCGSDVHYYLTGRIGSQVVEYPYRVGHEFAATVRDVGPAVTRVKPDDRVTVDPAMSCGTCDQCRSGRPHTCRHLRFLGCPGQAEGCLSERIVMPEACCYPVGPMVSLEQAALIEPLSIGLYAVDFWLASRRPAGTEPARIGILGVGPIGVSVLLSAVARGMERIYVTDKLDPRLAVAREHGAAWAGNPEREDVVAGVQEREPLLLDAVFECCGEQEALDQGAAMLRPGGTLMLIGIPTVDRVSFEIDTLRRRELCIQNVRRQTECVQPVIDLIRAGRMDPSFMITHRFPFERTQDALELVADYRDGVVKAVIEMG